LDHKNNPRFISNTVSSLQRMPLTPCLHRLNLKFYNPAASKQAFPHVPCVCLPSNLLPMPQTILIWTKKEKFPTTTLF
jgi:hypothetical protein